MTPDEYFQGQLDTLKGLRDAGHMLQALHDAVLFCSLQQTALPKWAVTDIVNLLYALHQAPSLPGAGKGGAFKSPKGRFKKDYAHFLRWSVFAGCLRLRGLQSKPVKRRGRPRAGAQTDVTLFRDALKDAAEKLRGSIGGRAEPREIEKSYDLVEAARAKGDMRYSFEEFLSM
jgi:hypothetical protein